MNKVKVRFFTLISLIALLIVTFALAVGSVLPGKFAQAVTAVDYDPGAVFAAGVGGTVGASEAGEGDSSYVEFSLSDGGKVHFRRDLALKWYSAAQEGEEGDPDAATPGIARHFKLVFSFPSLDFETLTLEFSGDEENISKDGQAVNSIVFIKNDDGSLTAVVKNAALWGEDLSLLHPALCPLVEKGVAVVILTLGAKGLVWRTKEGESGSVPAFRVEAVDTTGAGDTLAGYAVGALGAYAETGSTAALVEGLRTAAAAAALSVMKEGAVPSIPKRADVERFLTEHSA